MRITKQQLRRIIKEAVRSKLREDLTVETDLDEAPKPRKGTSVKTRAPARAAVMNPQIEEAVVNLVGAVQVALEEVMGDASDDALMDLDQSLHTEFHNDVLDKIDEWMNTYTEALESGQLGDQNIDDAPEFARHPR